MLLQVREYIQREGLVSIQQLAREFSMDEQALQPMLMIWVNKGVIQPCHEKPACQSHCFGCSKKLPLYYRYILKMKNLGLGQQ